MSEYQLWGRDPERLAWSAVGAPSVNVAALYFTAREILKEEPGRFDQMRVRSITCPYVDCSGRLVMSDAGEWPTCDTCKRAI